MVLGRNTGITEKIKEATKAIKLAFIPPSFFRNIFLVKKKKDIIVNPNAKAGNIIAE